jgi:hypothetical protein
MTISEGSSMTAARRSVAALSFAIALAAFPAAAYAGESAESLFKEGRALLDAKQYDAACPKLAKSHALDPGAGTLLALALCHEGQGKTKAAWAELQEAAELGRRVGRTDLAKAAEKRARDLEKTLSRLVVRMPDGDTTGYEVRCDGEPIAETAWNTPVVVDAGEHRVEVRAPGKAPRSYVVRLAGPGVVEIVVEPLDDAPRPTAVRSPEPRTVRVAMPESPAPAEESRGGAQRAIGLVIAGAGVVGLGAGAYFGGRALSEQSANRRACPTSPCPDGVVVDNDSARSALNGSLVSVAAGTGALALGSILYFTAPRSTPARGTAPRSRTTARVVPEASPSQLGVGVVGTF